ncbi:retroviral-like aspartic protease family protein [Cupriavidus sp. 30B13]|uniref:retroviral-like aspartic protease family protein n=1 Tax=Cupriavidus sp. 30B13 TaxID=3384241 RepID=UPI003B919B89
MPSACIGFAIQGLLPGCSDETGRYAQTIGAYELQAVPARQISRAEIAKPLDELTREACDRQAASSLARALLDAGYRREAANVLVKFAGKCPQGVALLPGAVPILSSIGDLSAALEVATRVVAENGTSAQARFARGEVLRRAGRYGEALDDYMAVLSLADQPSRLSGDVFAGAAEARAKTGQPCEASGLVRMWIGWDPARRDTAQARALAEKYAQEGQCERATATRPQVFARKRGEVVTARVSVNGLPGTFIVDTGASFVSLSEGFAQRAGVSEEKARRIQLRTANGVTDAMLATSKTVTLGTAEAASVPVAIMKGMPFGPKIDGLLGQSFLSQFEVNFQPDRWTLSERSANTARH